MRRNRLVGLMRFAGIALAVGGLGVLGWAFAPFMRGLELDFFAPSDTPTPRPQAFSPAHLTGEQGGKTLWLPLVAGTGMAAAESNAAAEPAAPVTAEIAAPAAEEDVFAGYLSSTQKVVLRIQSPAAVNGGKAIKVAVQPGEDCEYGARRACLSRHWGNRVTLLTVHSGLGGEGEAFRSAMEGTGLNLAFYSFERIQANLAALSGAAVSMQSGDASRGDLTLSAALRIPPEDLADYFEQPFDSALSRAAEDSPALQAALDSGRPLLIFEICGWQLPGEPWAPEVSPTTASIYLGVIQEN